MRRSIQITSACAFLMVAAGPVTGFSDGLAAEAEKLPCNNFCRTWMGYETGEAAPLKAAPGDIVTAKPNEVSHETESAVDNPAKRSAPSQSASQTDVEGQPSQPKPKPKRKAEPDVADVSGHRSLAERSKTGKLAKRPELDDDTVHETRSGSVTSPSRPPLQAEENVKTLLRDRNATSSQSVKMSERDIPLPPRLPHALRPGRTGVAQAGQNAADALRAGLNDEEPTGSRASSKAPRTGTPALYPSKPQADAPQPVMGSIASSAAKTVARAPKDVVGDRVAASPPSLASPPNDAPRVMPQSEQPQAAVPERAETAANGSPSAAPLPAVGVVGTAASDTPPPTGRTVASAPLSDKQAAQGTPKLEASPPIVAVGADATGKNPPRAATLPAIGVDGTAAPDAPPSTGQAVASAPLSDKQAAQGTPKLEASPSTVAVGADATGKNPPSAATLPAVEVDGTAAPDAPPSTGQAVASASLSNKQAGIAPKFEASPPAVEVGGEAAGKNPSSALGMGSGVTVDGTEAATPSSPEGRTVGPQSAPDNGPMGVASRAASPPSAGVVSGEAMRKDPPTTLGNGPAVAVDSAVAAASPSSAVQAVRPATDADKPLVGVTSQAAVPPEAVMVSGEAASKDPATSIGNGSSVVVGAGPDPEATSATANNGAARGNRSDDHQPAVAAPPDIPAPAVSGLSVPVPGQAPVDNDTSVTAMNEPPHATSEIAPRISQSPPALLNAPNENTPEIGARAEPPAPSGSIPTKAPVGSGYGALGKFDNTGRAPPSDTASIVMAPPPGALTTEENPANLVKIAIGDVSTLPEGTTIAYTITNAATAPVDLLFVRCNAVDPTGTVVGSAFDYVENIPAGQQVKRVVRMSSDVTALGQTFSCANDAAPQ